MHLKNLFKGESNKKNEFPNHSDSDNSILKSKNKTNIFQWFKKDKNDDDIKPVNKKSCEKTNSSDIRNKEPDNKPIETKNKNSNIFKNIFLKKISPDQSIDFSLDKFKTIDLPTLTKRVNWKKRNDTKFVAHVSEMNSLIETLCSEYLIMEHRGKRVMHYMTEYLDTPDHTMFRDHQSNCEHRYKVRKRRYENENGVYMEVKEKIKGETYKHRILNPTPDEMNEFIKTNTPYSSHNLNTMLFVSYERITFIHKTLPIKITIDKNMKVGNGNTQTPFDNLVILELKTEKSPSACTINMIKSKGFKSCSISKYCIGIVTLYPELKITSKYNPTLLEIKKISKI